MGCRQLNFNGKQTKQHKKIEDFQRWGERKAEMLRKCDFGPLIPKLSSVNLLRGALQSARIRNLK